MSKLATIMSAVGICILISMGCAKKGGDQQSRNTESDKVPVVTEEEAASAFDSPPAPEEQSPDPRIAMLIEQLHHEDEIMVADAAYQLGQMKIQSTSAAEELSKLLGNYHAVRLPSTGKFRKINTLAGEVLSGMGESAMPILLKKLSDQDNAITHQVIIALSIMGEPAVEPLIQQLDTDQPGCSTAAEALTKIGTPSVEPLMKLLAPGNPNQTRKYAAKILGDIGDKKAVGDLIVALKDEDEWLRLTCADALGKIKDPAAFDPLCRLLAEGSAANDRRSAARALTGLGLQKAGTPLIAALQHENTRITIISALGRLKVSEAVPPLVKIMEEEDAKMSRVACAALGLIGDPKALEPLLSFLKKAQDDETLFQVITSLGLLGNPRAVPALNKMLEEADYTMMVQCLVVALIEIQGSKAAPTLVKRLRSDKSGTPVRGICKQLSRMGNPAVAPLFSLVEDGTFEKFSPQDQKMVIYALEGITRVKLPKDPQELSKWWAGKRQHYADP